MRIKDIKGYEGKYAITDDGRVYSYKSEKYLRPSNSIRKGDPRGYLFVTLSKNGKKEHFRIHRLVAEYFIPNPENKPEIDHIDGQRMNNNYQNLRWATPKENMANENTKKKQRGVCGARKHPVAQISLDGELIATYPTIAEASRATGIPTSCIGKNALGITNTAHDFIFLSLKEN